MAFTQNSRVWWDTTQPGASTEHLSDATPSAGLPASADEDTGIVGVAKGKLVICARSGFTVPESETVIDPVTGGRVWARFVDPEPAELTETSPPASTPVRVGDV